MIDAGNMKSSLTVLGASRSRPKGELHLRSRNDKDFRIRYPDVATALVKPPDETVIDGEVVALDLW
jgi:ATP-dependent DNA ligase